MILRLGHAELRVTDLAAARAFYVDVLGLIESHSEPGRLYLRAAEEFDLWTLALTEAAEPGLDHFALRVDSPDEIERLARVHADLGLPADVVPADREPGQGEALRVLTPEGFPVEYYHHIEQISPYDARGNVRLPQRPERPRPVGTPLRIDHMNMRTADMAQSLRYWIDTLGFSISEFVEHDDGQVFAAWMRRKAGNHDVALVAADAPSLHHVAYFVADPAAIIGLADACADAGLQRAVEFGPGRHGLSNALFLYVRDPSGNRVELYTGDYVRDLDLEPIRWSWDDYDRHGRLWWAPEFPAGFRECLPMNDSWLSQPTEAVEA